MEIIPNYHPMLVHFSVALLTISAFFYSASLLFGSGERSQTFLAAARWNLWVGVAISFVTVLTGWLAYNSVAHDALSHKAMTLHMKWALPTLGLWIIVAIWGFLSRKTKPSLIFILFLWISTSSLLVTGYLGAENVYRHGIGVMRLPAPMGEGHGHEEGADGHAHSALDTNDDHGVNVLESEHMPAHQESPNSHDSTDGHEH